MGQLVDQLGHKAAGELIRSQDWNALVAAVEAVDTKLSQRIDTLETTLTQQITTVTTQLTQLRTEFTAFRTAVSPILDQYYHVTLRTTKLTFALGELAEVTAQVVDLDGNIAPSRPWIDFVTAWGQLKPVPGFESLGGTGDRTLSVRTNAQGIAKVLLRAEHVDGFNDDDENEVAAALTTRLQVNNRSLSEVILQAQTPMEADVKGAFQVLSKEYDRPDARSVRSYVDTYYVKNAAFVTGKLAPGLVDRFRTRWRDYRSTVMAFAKSDGDPLTADQSSGVSSIQVTFRDWISPWIILDYVHDSTTTKLADGYVGRFQPKITTDYKKSVQQVRQEVENTVRDSGLIGKLQRYQAVNKALDRVTGNQPFLNTLTESVQSAINIQQTLESTQLMTVGTFSEAIAFNVFTDASVRADTNVAGVSSDLAGLQQQFGQTEQKFKQLDTQFSTLQAGLTDLNGRSTNSFTEVRGSLTALQQLSEQRFNDFSNRFNDFNGKFTTLTTNYGVLNDRTNTLFNQGGQFRQEIDGVKNQVQRFQGIEPANLVTTANLRGAVNNALVENNLLKNLRIVGPG